MEDITATAPKSTGTAGTERRISGSGTLSAEPSGDQLAAARSSTSPEPIQPRLGEGRRILTGGLALLGSGGVASLCFIGITSGRISIVDPAVAVVLLLFVQWQAMGLTIAKLGADVLAFAEVSGDPAIHLKVGSQIATRTVPLAFVFSAVVAVNFSPVVAVLCFASIVLDTYSAIAVSELGARQRYVQSAAAGLFNYPIFFLLLFGFSYFRVVGITEAVGLFLFSSIARWCYLLYVRRPSDGVRERRLAAGFRMGIQQLLNYLLFRADQVFLGLVIAQTVIQHQSGDFLRQYLYLARFPELISQIVVALGAILLPRLFIDGPDSRVGVIQVLRRRWPLLATYAGGVCLTMILYLPLYKGAEVPSAYVAAFLLAGLTALPVNVVTYSLLRRTELDHLVRWQTLSVAFGLCFLAVAAWTQSPLPLVIAVPAQQIAFLLLACCQVPDPRDKVQPQQRPGVA